MMNIALIFALVTADLTLATLIDGDVHQRMPWAPMYWYRGPHRPPEMIVMRPPSTKIQRHKKSPSIAEQQQQQQQNYDNHHTHAMGISRPHYFPQLPPSQANNNNFTSVYFNYDSSLRLPYRQLTHHPYQAVTPDYDHNVYNQLKYRSTTSRPRRAPLTTTATPRPKIKPKDSKPTNNKRHVDQQRNVNSRIYSRNYTHHSNYDKRQHRRPQFDMEDHYDRGFERLDQQIPSPPPIKSEYNTKQSQQPSYDFENDDMDNYPKSLPNAQLYYQNNAQRQRPANAPQANVARRREENEWKQNNGRRFDTSTEKFQDANDYVYSVYDDVEVFKGYESQRTNQHQTTMQKQKRQRQ